MGLSKPPKKRLPAIPAPHVARLRVSNVTRAEFNSLIRILAERGEILEGMRRTLEVQFKRMAQMQAELDQIKRAWVRMQGPR